MNNQELISLLKELIELFTPNSFETYRCDMSARESLKPLLSKAANLLFEITDAEHQQRIDLIKVAKASDQLSFLQCAQYMIYYLRLYFSQGGGELFIQLWLDGSTERVLDRMMNHATKIN